MSGSGDRRAGAGNAEGRDIVAIVAQDGQVRDELSVAAYEHAGAVVRHRRSID